MDASAITKLPPKTLMLIAVGGVGAGLIWRKMSQKNGSAQEIPDTAALEDYYGLGYDTVGGDAGNNRREQVGIGDINLPVTEWIVTIGGKKFRTDGTNLIPLDPVINIPTDPDRVENPPQNKPKPPKPTNAPAGLEYVWNQEQFAWTLRKIPGYIGLDPHMQKQFPGKKMPGATQRQVTKSGTPLR